MMPNCLYCKRKLIFKRINLNIGVSILRKFCNRICYLNYQKIKKKKEKKKSKSEKYKNEQKRREKIRQFRKGKHHSMQTKKKISESHKGSKHYNWKGGISSEITLLRTSFEMRQWKLQVLKRDNYTCQITGEQGGKLVIHHIECFSKNPNLRFDVTNGIVLRKDIHYDLHKKYGWFTTREHLTQYRANLDK